MRKSEMTERQIEDRDTFVRLLTKESWDPRGWEILFASNQILTPEAQAEYQNRLFNLRASYFVADGYVLLEAVAHIGELAISLRLYPAGSIEDVVEATTAWQNRLTDENWPEFVESLKPLSRLILFETSDKLVEIT